MSKKFSIQQEPGFYLDRDKSTMPRISGIYVVYRCNYDSFMDVVDVKEVLYIGESKNINVRHNGTPDHPSEHEHYDEFAKQAGGANSLCYSVIPLEEYSEEERIWIQDAMIFSQQPPLNKGAEKTDYSHLPIDLSLNAFPDCWKTHHIQLPK